MRQGERIREGQDNFYSASCLLCGSLHRARLWVRGARSGVPINQATYFKRNIAMMFRLILSLAVDLVPNVHVAGCFVFDMPCNLAASAAFCTTCRYDIGIAGGVIA